MKKLRLDEILIEKGIASDKDDAFVKVTEGLIFVDGQKAVSPAQPIDPEAKIEVRGKFPYVGRGAFKLEAALQEFHVSPAGKICADIGSATGGFVEILLKYGAKRVYAIDTARGKLDLKLREDPRVVVMEETDVRDLQELPEKIDLVTIDVSLISLREILTHVGRLIMSRRGADHEHSGCQGHPVCQKSVIALFKPQYETRDPKILRHGIIREKAHSQKLLRDFIRWAEDNGWKVEKWVKSPIRGSEGNLEFLLHLTPNA